MSEQRIIQDADGNRYALPADALVQAADGTYEVDEAALAAALVDDEVAGYANNPIPGIDIIVRKYPPGKPMAFTDFGSVAVPYGGPTAPRAAM